VKASTTKRGQQKSARGGKSDKAEAEVDDGFVGFPLAPEADPMLFLTTDAKLADFHGHGLPMDPVSA